MVEEDKKEGEGVEEPSASELLEELEKEDDKDKEKPSVKKKQNKQIMWAIILMASIILIIVLVPYITTNYVNQFVYLNLDFQKTKLGELTFYSTMVPIVDSDSQIVNSYTMNFRNHPKELEKIEFSRTHQDVDYVYFKKDEAVYISLNPEIETCEDTGIAMIPFAGFLRDFAKQEVASAVNDEDYAKNLNLSYVTCENSPNNTVLYLKEGEETKIIKTATNCYELTYNDCEIVEIIERFELLVLEKYMSYFTREDESVLDDFKFWEE